MICNVKNHTRIAVVSAPVRAVSHGAAVRPCFLESIASTAAPARRLSAQATTESREKAAPPGLAKYETLIILKPTLTDEERDQELARFESFLHQEECQDVKAMVRGRQRMAYPIKGNWEGIYVLFSFIAKYSTTPKVQKLLSTPISGKEDNILRHMTFRY